MKTNPILYVVTGAESTGKTSLAEWLANYFNVPFIPEFAREYIEGLDRDYNYSDIEFIARKQVEQINALKNAGYPFVFLDTWLIITLTWFEFVFGKKPPWIEHELLDTKIGMFLVCNIDLPWKPDPVRENGGENRVILHNKYIETIKKYNFKYHIISGKNNERNNCALNYLNIQDQ